MAASNFNDMANGFHAIPKSHGEGLRPTLRLKVIGASLLLGISFWISAIYLIVR